MREDRKRLAVKVGHYHVHHVVANNMAATRELYRSYRKSVIHPDVPFICYATTKNGHESFIAQLFLDGYRSTLSSVGASFAVPDPT